MYIAALGYALVTLVFVAPLINYVHLADASYGGDSRLLIWTLAWDAHALLSGTPLFDANMFHPAPGALKWAEHHIGLGLFALPVYALTANPVLAYWTIWLLSFPLNALAMYALAWRLTGGRRAAAMAGLIYGFCFFRMHHGHGHIQMLWTWALPLIPLALERWLHRPTARTTTTVAALVLIQALTSWYLAVFTGLLCLITAVTLTRVRDITARHMRHAAVAVAAAAVPLAWFARPYFALRAPGVGEVLGLSADAAAYLLPPENTWIGQWILTNTTVTPREIWGEQTLYAGYTAIALAIAGAWALARGRTSAAAGADRLTRSLLK